MKYHYKVIHENSSEVILNSEGEIEPFNSYLEAENAAISIRHDNMLSPDTHIINVLLDESSQKEFDHIRTGFARLMGMNGDKYVTEIFRTGKLSKNSYDSICENVSYNGKSSIVEYFGIAHWYYLKSKRY